MAEPKIKIHDDLKGKYQSVEATVSIEFDLDDRYGYARGHGCDINPPLNFEQTEYGWDELEAMQNLNCSLLFD